MKGFLQVEEAEALGAEAEVEEGVEEWVEAAVDVSQAGCIGMSQKKEVQEGAGVRSEVQVRKSVHGLHDVEGHPACSKHHHQCGDDLEQAAFALVLLAQAVEVTCDGAADESVTHHHGQKGDQKAESGGGDAEAGDPKCLLTRFAHHQAEVHGARGIVGLSVVHRGTKQQRRCSQHTWEEPDGGQRGPHVSSGPQLCAGEGVNDGHVAVQTQAGEAEDTGVHVEQHHIAADLAEGHAKRPVVFQGGVDGPQRQGHHKGQVSNSQVSNVNVCSSPFGLSPPYGEDDHTIPSEAQYKDEHVEHRNQRIWRLPLVKITHWAVCLFVIILAVVSSHVVHGIHSFNDLLVFKVSVI